MSTFSDEAKKELSNQFWSSPIQARFDFYDSKGNIQEIAVYQFFDKFLESKLNEQRIVILDELDVTIEAWMAVHENQERTFSTEGFMNYLRESILEIKPKGDSK